MNRAMFHLEMKKSTIGDGHPDSIQVTNWIPANEQKHGMCDCSQIDITFDHTLMFDYLCLWFIPAGL